MLSPQPLSVPLERRFIKPDYDDFNCILDLFKLSRLFVEQVIEDGDADEHVHDLQTGALEMFDRFLPRHMSEAVLISDAVFPPRAVIRDSDGNAAITPLRTRHEKATFLALLLEDYGDFLETHDEPGHAYVYAFTDALRSLIADGLR